MFKSESGSWKIQVEVIYENDSLWLNQNQIGELFERDKSVISRHIRNIFKEGELEEYLVQGYAVDKKRLIQKEEEIQILKNGIAILGKVIEEKSSDESNAWLAHFAQGLSLLDDYDHERLDTK